MNRRIIAYGLFALGGLLFLAGILVLLIVPGKIQTKISEEIFLGLNENGTYNELTAAWADPKYSMETHFTIYSVNNAMEIFEGGFPNFTQRGPYVFTEYQHKSKVNFLQNGTRVVYRNKHIYVFNVEKSCENCSLTDKVVIPNVIFQALIDLVTAHPVLKYLIESVLAIVKEEGPFIETTVGEMLFDGYNDPLIMKICKLIQIASFCKDFDIPRIVRFFANNTDDGEYYIDSGLTNSQNIAKVYSWNSQNATPDSWWYSKEARMINGTDGQLFSPDLSRYNDFYVFSGQLGRSIFFRFEKDNELENLSVYQFLLSKDLYNWLLPENSGFCSGNNPVYLNDTKLQPNGCLPLGLLDLSSTRPGNPRIIVSSSRFLNVPEELYRNYTGFSKPDPETDQTYMEVEPVTGTVVKVKQSSQLNVGMISGNLRIVKNMRNLVVPLFSMHEYIYFDSETRRKLLQATGLKSQVYLIGLVILILGCLLPTIVGGVLCFSRFLKRSDEDEELLIPNEQQQEDSIVQE